MVAGSQFNFVRIRANGPAVEGVNVGGVSPSVTSPGALGRICPGGQAAMAQFLQIPAKDKIVSVARICPEPKSRII